MYKATATAVQNPPRIGLMIMSLLSDLGLGLAHQQLAISFESVTLNAKEDSLTVARVNVMNAADEQSEEPREDGSVSPPNKQLSETTANQKDQNTVDHSSDGINKFAEGLRAGDVIGNYRLVEMAGEGTFGIVWRADDLRLDRSVALKVAKRPIKSSADSSNFFREARAAAKLQHPNIVGVFDVGEDQGLNYIVSNFIYGQPLNKLLAGQRFMAKHAADLCRRIADAIAHAHEKSIIHRDLKPSNILIDTAGEPHVLDFGLAKLEQADFTCTSDDMVLGTPSYMSPEQAVGNSRQASSRTDVYSLGVILFQLLTGELPFRGTAHAVIRHHIETPAPSLRSLDPKIPADLDTIVLKCLEKSPQHRFDNAQLLADELRRFLAGEPLSFRPQGAVTRFARWFLNNPDVSRETTGIAYVLAGGLMIAWASIGLVVTISGMYGIENRGPASMELLWSIFVYGLPLVLVGRLVLAEWNQAIKLAFAFSIMSLMGVILFGFGVLGHPELHGNLHHRFPLVALLFCVASLLVTMAGAAEVSRRIRRQSRNEVLFGSIDEAKA